MLLIHQAVQQHQIYPQKNTPLVSEHFISTLYERQTLYKYQCFTSEDCWYTVIIVNILS
jgi:hypothetical protein